MGPELNRGPFRLAYYNYKTSKNVYETPKLVIGFLVSGSDLERLSKGKIRTINVVVSQNRLNNIENHKFDVN